MKRKSHTAGLSLIETLIAVGLLIVLTLGVSSFIVTLSRQAERNRVLLDVDAQSHRIVLLLTQSMRNATAITLPTVGASAGSATLQMGTLSAENPTLFTLSGGVLSIQKGASAAQAITTSTVSISAFSVTNLTPTNGDGTLRISFTITSVSPSNRPDLAYSKTVRTTVSLR